jgi:hypothetical protein
MPEARDFFISYNRADERWAEWIAWALDEAGFSHYFQKWDFRPGGNFVLDMQRAALDSKRTLLVLSNAYLGALYTQPEWAAAFAQDPTGAKRLVLPVRVEPCTPAGMLAPIVYCDLVGLAEDAARERLLEALRDSGKPERPPAFPGTDAGAAPAGPAGFPGHAVARPAQADPLREAAESLASIFATTRATFLAQARLRDDLAERVRTRLGVREHLEFEALFDRYFDRFDADELRLHRTIRAYTETVLHEYNRRTLETVERAPRLADVLPSLPALRQHLILWLAKYERVFTRVASMCLLYVGVEEDAGFPPRIESELVHYLETGGRLDA